MSMRMCIAVTGCTRALGAEVRNVTNLSSMSREAVSSRRSPLARAWAPAGCAQRVPAHHLVAGPPLPASGRVGYTGGMSAHTFMARVTDTGAAEPLEGGPAQITLRSPPAPGTIVRVSGSGGWDEVAAAGGARAAVWEVVARHELRVAYPEAAEAEVSRLQAAPGIDAPDLVDLRDIGFVTIDQASSRDLDQAVWVERDGPGLRLLYALADAAYYVPPGSALFEEALQRGASFYLPGLSIPMLPAALSEGLVSLNPGVERRALVFDVRIAADGTVTGLEIVRARIRSRAKLSFSGVQELLDTGAGPLAGTGYADSLRLLRLAGERLAAKADDRDVVRYDRRESAVAVVDDTLVIREEARLEVEEWNAQISILCNQIGARWLLDRGDPWIQGIYRIHGAPGPERLETLRRRILGITRRQRLGGRWVWDGHQSLAAYLDGLPGDYEHVRAAIQRQVLVTNERSVFAAEPGLHHALGVDPYARFTAPMREIVGIFTHAEAVERPTGDPAVIAQGEAMREAVIAAGNRAKELQKRLTKNVHMIALDDLLRDDLAGGEAPARPGAILGLTPGRLYVQLEAPPTDVKVYLDGGRLSRDGSELTVGGRRYRLGDQVTLRTTAFDGRAQRWHFDVQPMPGA